MFDIKAHKPQNKIRFHVYWCDSCAQSIPYPREVKKCAECEGKVKHCGSFWILAEMISRQEMDSFVKSARPETTLFQLFDEKVRDWGEMLADEGDFPCTPENKRMFYDNQPTVADYIVGMLQQRDLFGMIAVSEFKKKLSKHKNGSLPTGKRKKNLQTADDA